MKKQILNKTISLLMAMLMLFCLLPAGLFAEDEEIVDPETALEETLAFIAETVSPVFNPNSFLSDDWEVIAIARAGFDVREGYYQGYYESVLDALEDDGASIDFGANAKIILALTAIGADATSFEGHNLLLPLADYDNLEGLSLMDLCYSLIALDSKPYDIPAPDGGGRQTTREDIVDLILALKDDEHGYLAAPEWGFWGFESDTNAIALQALAPYQNMPDVKNVTDEVLGLLYSFGLNEDGGYASFGSVSAEAIAQVIVAATALGYDPAVDSKFTKTGNPLSRLLADYYEPGGGFTGFDYVSMENKVTKMATQQAAYALVAYTRYLQGACALYDMRDCPPSYSPSGVVYFSALDAILTEARTKQEADYTEATWNFFDEKLEIAEEVRARDGVKQSAINSAVRDLQIAVKSLRLATASGGEEEEFFVHFSLRGLGSATDNEEMWISNQRINNLWEGATVADVIIAALYEAGYPQDGAQSGYVISVTTPGGFFLKEGHQGMKDSGWLFLVNNRMPEVGMDNVAVRSGDTVLLYFTKDFRQDEFASVFSGDDFYADQAGGAASSTVAAAAVITGKVAAVNIDGAKIAAALKEALDKLKDANDTNAVAEVAVGVTGIGGATSVQVNVDTASLKAIAEANGGKARLTIDTGLAKLSFDAKTLAGFVQGAAAGAMVEFFAELVDPSVLDEDIRDIVGDSPIFNLSVTIGANKIHDFNGTVTVTLPYDLPEGADPGTLTVYWLDGEGKPVPMENVRYDSARKEFVFTTTHFSFFFIDALGLSLEKGPAEGDWANPFTDVKKGDWFYEVVEYVYVEGLMVGIAGDQFAPDMPLNRATMLTVLHRLAGSPTVSLADMATMIPAGMWYSDALAWADEIGLLANVGSGLLDSPDLVTREELVAILLNYELLTEKIPKDILADRMFADWQEINDWAKNAVNRLTMQGLLGGKPGNLFDPKGGATRAEFAAILNRYLVNLNRW